ncbi:MAG TPA: TonB-dependent receptor [Steroidobacteraceae bacterium]|jgi:hypothetical protein|nr:TonB-dependent receptor [Steroidobacteraceae bacterium]
MTRGESSGAALGAALVWLSFAANAANSVEAPVAFDIPAQPMAAALNAWAIQANAQVFVDPGPVAHLTAPAIKGTLTPRQALRALLAKSNLQVTQGTDGVFVIKPRVVLAAAPPAAPPPSTPTPAIAAPPPRPTALASGGPWLAGVTGAYAKDNGGPSGGATAVFDAGYFFTDHVAAALAVSTPRSHQQFSALSVRYHFTPENQLDAYLGAGLDIEGQRHCGVGPLAEAGIDFNLSPHWLLNANVSRAQVQDIHVDPMQFGIGVLYRF